MSADDFDPDIERLFARAPVLDGAEAFAATVQARIGRDGRVRRIALALAGGVGGVVAVRESVGGDLRFRADGAEAAGGFTAGIDAAQARVMAGLDGLGLGLGHADSGVQAFGSLGGMQLFWIVAGLLAAAAAVGAVRLFQEA